MEVRNYSSIIIIIYMKVATFTTELLYDITIKCSNPLLATQINAYYIIHHTIPILHTFSSEIVKHCYSSITTASSRAIATTMNITTHYYLCKSEHTVDSHKYNTHMQF